MAADPVPQPEPAAPVITITFAGVGMADHAVSLENVTHAQVYAAAWVLESMARELRAAQLAQQAPRRLVIPPPGAGPRRQ